MSTIDLYIARRLARPFLATGAVVILLLSLENSRRLMGLLDNVEQPVAVLIKLMVYLVPEYLGIGLLISVFVAVAVAFRGFAISGELDIFASIGLSPARLLRVPLLLALAVAMLHAGLRAYVEPAGEQRLDALGTSIAIGNLGLSIAPGEFLRPRPDTVFHVDAVDRRTGEFRGLFLRNPDLTVAARAGRAINGGRDGVRCGYPMAISSSPDRPAGPKLHPSGHWRCPSSCSRQSRSAGRRAIATIASCWAI